MFNAVLRRAIREAPAALEALGDTTPQEAAIRHSVPDWIAELWWAELGEDDARALLARINQPAESALRINTLKAVDVELPVRSHQADELPEGRVLDEPFDAFGSPLWRSGTIMPQSRGSMLVVRALDPQPGERVLDLCAAPGAKTTHLAALMGGEGEITAVEVHPGRAHALRRTCDRMGADSVGVERLDGRELPPEWAAFDRVLVDPPCSGLGTMQSRPDLRWQAKRGETEQLVAKQSDLIRAGADAVKPGGTLVYSVCTISQAEGEGVVAAFTAERAEFTVESRRQLLPHRDGTDGFFIARLHRD
jgi:16S rRNA (cytosine967-C5)-methyltransferase